MDQNNGTGLGDRWMIWLGGFQDRSHVEAALIATSGLTEEVRSSEAAKQIGYGREKSIDSHCKPPSIAWSRLWKDPVALISRDRRITATIETARK